MSRFQIVIAVVLIAAVGLTGCSRVRKAERLFEQGLALEKSGDMAAAAELYQQAVRAEPKFFLPHKHLGNIFAARKQYDQALTEYAQAIALAPDHAANYYNRAITWSSQGRLPEAMADYTQALVLDPAHFDAALGRAGIYYTQGEYQKSIMDSQAAMNMRPLAGRPYLARAVAQLVLGETASALTDLEQAIRLEPALSDDVAKVIARIREIEAGRKAQTQGPSEESVDSESVRARIALDPDNYKNYLELANFYTSMGEGLKAVENAGKALSLDPQLAAGDGAYLTLTMGYYYSGQLQKSYESVEKAAQYQPGNTTVLGLKTMLENARQKTYGGVFPEQVSFAGYTTAAEAGRALLKEGYGFLGKDSAPDQIYLPELTVTITPPPGWQRSANVNLGPGQKAFLVYQKDPQRMLPSIGVTRDPGQGVDSAIEFSRKAGTMMAERFDLAMLKEVEVNGQKAAFLKMVDKKGKVEIIWYQFLVGNDLISFQYMNEMTQDDPDFAVFEALIQAVKMGKP